jgi:hypothetical protein
MKLLIQIGSQLLALPPHYTSFVGENPTSADAIRSSETQLVKRVERKHTYLGRGLGGRAAPGAPHQDGPVGPRSADLETVWRDPSTPTVAQKADAVTKLVSRASSD